MNAAPEVNRAAPRVARVLIDSPLPQLDRLFDYEIPAELVPTARPGVRVKVPLRSAGRIADGFIVELAERGDYDGALSPLEAVVSPVPVLAPEIWTLARRLADRAAGVASDIIRLAIPKRQVRVEKAWLAARHAAAEDSAAEHAVAKDAAAHDSGAEHAVTETAAPVAGVAAPGYPDSLTVHSGTRLAVDAIPRLIKLAARDGGDEEPVWVGHWAATAAALATQSLAAGRSAILAVPDYRDQEQLVAALRTVLPVQRIVQLDARQPAPARYGALLACLGDAPLAIVGNRSALYAPAADLGLIAVWDDGDPSHAEPLAPYVHSRDIALIRAEQQNAALVFLAHTRSTEVQRLVELGWLREAAPVPAYTPRVLPTAAQPARDPLAAAARIPSAAWQAARAGLETGPVLVQVARPGYAPSLSCEDCREIARCTACQGPLGTRTANATPACRWCGALAVNWQCPNCEGHRFRLIGQGTVRTAEDLGRAFPGVRVIIADGERPILTVPAEPALVIATRGAEPIAAGGYSTVLLLDGERMLARESLRVAEDCLRWWTNAAALAAVGAPVVLVGVGGRLASAMATWRPAAHAAAELAERRQLRFPPAVRVATVTGTPEAVGTATAKLLELDGVDILGPTDTPEGVRAIVRFEYGQGTAVAAAIKAEIIRNATARRKRLARGDRPGPALPTLKARFDDGEPFVD